VKNARSLSDEAKDMLRKGVAIAMQEKHLAALDVYDEFRQEFSDAFLSDEEHEDMMRAIGDWKQESLPSKAKAAE
jgi:antitoxin FitA